MTRRQTEQTVAALGAVTAVSAIGGSIYGLGGAASVPREWLEGSPFETYTVPSLILGFGVAGTSAGAAITAWRGQQAAAPSTALAGAVLSGWIATQVAVIGPRSLLQPLMGGIGIAMIVLGAKLRRFDDVRLGAVSSAL